MIAPLLGTAEGVDLVVVAAASLVVKDEDKAVGSAMVLCRKIMSQALRTPCLPIRLLLKKGCRGFLPLLFFYHCSRLGSCPRLAGRLERSKKGVATVLRLWKFCLQVFLPLLVSFSSLF